MKKRFARLLALLIAAILAVTLAPLPASATSSYDDYDFTLEDVLLDHYQCANNPVNVSTFWSNPFYAFTDPMTDPYVELKSLLSLGKGYAVVQSNNSRMEVIYSSSPNAYLRFSTSGGLRQIELTSTNPADIFSVAILDLWDDCTLNTGSMYSADFNGYSHSIASDGVGGYDYNKILLSTFDVEYPLGYEGELIPSTYTPNPSKYVAMGDSFSSGEGAFSYDASSGACHRSMHAYPYYVARKKSLGAPLFVACSGAMTDDLYNTNPLNTSEAAQMDALTVDTEIVTLTIGGNDIGFESVMKECVTRPLKNGDDCRLGSVATITEARIDKLSGIGAATAPGGRTIHSIATILEDIATAAPNATIYISGYPHLFGETTTQYELDTNSPGEYKCLVYESHLVTASVSYSDALWLNEKADELNDVIENAVASLPAIDAVFVPLDTFNSHGYCDEGSPYLHSVSFDEDVLSNQPESFHPTQTGMRLGYGDAFTNMID